MPYKVILFFLNLVLPALINAQEPVFTATVSSTSVLQNSVFEVQFELQNAKGQSFEPPDFRQFNVVGGPMLSSSTMIVNGKVTRGESWSYSLVAPKAGTFIMGPATVVAGRKKMITKPITIKVVAAEDMAASGTNVPGQGPIKLIAHVKQGDYYPGQQIVLEYKLLFTENIQSVNTLSEDDYSDFFVQHFNSFSKEASFESIEGTTYVSRIIKALSLFAHQSGTYTIDPMVLMASISTAGPGNQGFFAMRRMHNVQVVSAPLTINILPLPPDRDTSYFSGAVGQYSLSTVQTSNPSLSTDDDFTVRIEIKGNGDSRRWDPPSIVTNGDFEIYDPRIIEDKMLDVEGSVLHSRIIEYSLIPLKAGEYDVHVPFRFFNPESKTYETIQTETFHLTVSQGNLQARSIQRDTAVMSPLPVRKVKAYRMNDRFWLSLPHLLLFGIFLAGTSWGLLTVYRRKREEAISPAERLRSLSSRQARNKLEALEAAEGQSDQNLFFENLTETYYRFLTEKFSIPPAELDEENIRKYLIRHHVPHDVIQRAITFFNECLSLRYGGLPYGSSRAELINTCRNLIDDLDTPSQHI